MSQAIAETSGREIATKTQLPSFAAPRLPYHPAIQERFGVTRDDWRALVDSIFPLAEDPASIILALSYCKARHLDPFKRPVHIVPMWNSQVRRMVETVWPGIGELRTTAFRTGQYAGRTTAYGPDITEKVGSVTLTYPEWAQSTVLRRMYGEKLSFEGPRVYWREAYASAKKDDPSPNAMWKKRPRGQLDKCAEAAALRAAFPEEIGNELTAEEMEGRTIGSASGHDVVARKTLAARLTEGRPQHDPDTGEIIEAQAEEIAPEPSMGAAETAEEGVGADDEPTEPESPRDALLTRLMAIDDVKKLRRAIGGLTEEEQKLVSQEELTGLAAALEEVG